MLNHSPKVVGIVDELAIRIGLANWAIGRVILPFRGKWAQRTVIIDGSRFPDHALSHVILKDGFSLSTVQPKAEEIADQWLENITDIKEMLMRGEIGTF